ncbi:protein of unknown function [Modestobacter italicus]|uniref:Uncharacterized protein n=1 Tax=Modestobacter italicus (strain DSM 44449 / CECT 9708 / BC 501) TaxID=2732864 RepID=I4F0W7_MODI5|nr:protein of unknown function [Modestobacter marinus]
MPAARTSTPSGAPGERAGEVGGVCLPSTGGSLGQQGPADQVLQRAHLLGPDGGGEVLDRRHRRYQNGGVRRWLRIGERRNQRRQSLGYRVLLTGRAQAFQPAGQCVTKVLFRQATDRTAPPRGVLSKPPGAAVRSRDGVGRAVTLGGKARGG